MPPSMMQGYGSQGQGNPLPPGSARPSATSSKPAVKGSTFSLSNNQILAIGLIVVGIALIVWASVTW